MSRGQSRLNQEKRRAWITD